MVNDCIKITGIYAMDHDRAITKNLGWSHVQGAGHGIALYKLEEAVAMTKPLTENMWSMQHYADT
ncbi:hypothetical protein LXL04_031370 [Taraxacum kok-saghyz]